MISVPLSKARAFEAEHRTAEIESFQPRFHVTAGYGWLNDPNGFSLYKGEYHLFFQYNPYSTKWDVMHWGHVKTKDFIRWERLPCALAPDQEYDRRWGCFSGSALELRDGRHLLIYTGVGKSEDGKDLQTQCLAFGDGVNYEKYEGNPVIPAELLPEGGSTEHFRDPKITATGDGFRVVAGNLDAFKDGNVLMFRSDDLLHWQLVSKVASSDNRLGRMWECPDLFELDGKDVLLVSPQEMRTGDMEFIEGNTTLYLVGKLNSEGVLERESEHTIDCGLDFYAPQTVVTEDGRRVMIAWMQYWNSVDVCPVDGLPFFGQMTLPRELHIKGRRLIQLPVRELLAYRGEQVLHTDVPVQEKTALTGVKGRCLDLNVRVRPGEGGYRSFSVNVAEGGDYVTAVRYDPKENTITVDRSKSGWPETVLNHRTFAVREDGGRITLRFILDRYSMELFVNDGERAATFAIFSPDEADGISFEAEGCAVVDVEQYTLDI
jgi:beta-fructofuranosidase